MNTEILGVILQWVALVVLSYPLGKYIAKVYKGEKTWSDFMKPVERLIFKVAGVNPNEEMNWKQFLKALLILNAFWFDVLLFHLYVDHNRADIDLPLYDQ